VLEGARFGDTHGFDSIWIPERHFHRFGGLFPNPSVLAAAIAALTRRISIRAGSVVLPLHDPLRVAEVWAVVDALSGGRVGIAAATGYAPKDFVLAVSEYGPRREQTLAKLDIVRRLWRGELIDRVNGTGVSSRVGTFPRPVQAELPIWLTCGGSDADKFAQAGALGANVLTALFVQSVDTLALRIASYRAARTQAGLDPAAGRVTLMIHTFIARSLEECREKVRQPFLDYLASSVEVWSSGFKRLEDVPPHLRDDMLAFAFERYFRTSALFGTVDVCARLVEVLAAAGVDELACLVDFGVPDADVVEGFALIDELRQRVDRT
jgi:natural product biosynthesis luciferase-like monooxygenase protein